MNYLIIVSIVACVAVAFVLARGLLSMARNEGGNQSQKLMRWRVILQAIAIIIMLLVVYMQS